MATSRKSISRFRLEPEGLTKKRPSPPKRKPVSKFHRSSDRYSFAHLAKVLTSGDRLNMLKAVDRLQGRARILVELACFSNFQFVRLASISHLIQDVDALIEIAKFCQYADTRSAALDELSSSDEALVEVSCSSLFKDTRQDAVSLLEDPDSLAEIAKRSPHRDSREAALERISDDGKALRKVAEGSRYRKTRVQAVEHLSCEPDVLSSLLSSEHRDVKKAAASRLSNYVEELDDVDALIEIAKISPNEDARYLAIGRLSEHPWALRTVVYESRFKDAKSTALMLLSDIVYEIEDPDMLTEVAMLSPYEDCRAVAVERLVGQSSALLSIAANSKFRDSRDLAIDKLKDDAESLKSISRLSKYTATRKKAHGLVSDPDVFKGELERILG